MSAEEREDRTAALLGDLALVPPLEDIDNASVLSDLQRDIVCDALGCSPDSRHRRKNPLNGRAS
ncbi:hypothetical protein ACIGZJ_36020 [Kitasatospora sp. NPDC052868]|uniref:hypothetical protein n=1 Tax=Kitasatospora sp. NPDC052868 TaxID=3364060 RepID=UPI0037C57019